jgi:serine/threonine protein kinase
LSALQISLTLSSEVESTDAERGGYKKAADLWSLGILTATLLTGSSVVAREQLTQLSRVQVVERFLGENPDTSTHWQDITARALSFLHGLLVLDPDKRLTATEALNHPWFKKPLSEAKLLEERYEKVLRFWRRRGDDEVIEHVPSRLQAGQEDQMVTLVPKSRRKIPDSTLSPYFGLDRHLQPKVVSKRKIILETLNESGSPFLMTEQNPNRTPFSSPEAPTRDFVDIKTVEGIDLFGAYRSLETTTLEERDVDEVCLLPTTRFIPQNENTFGLNMGVSLKALSSPANATQISTGEGGVGIGKCKMSRRESEDPEERSIRDSIAKALPRYSTAKVLKDAVGKKKQEIRSKNLGRLATSVPAV